MVAAIVLATLRFCKPARFVRFTVVALRVLTSAVPLTDKLLNLALQSGIQATITIHDNKAKSIIIF